MKETEEWKAEETISVHIYVLYVFDAYVTSINLL